MSRRALGALLLAGCLALPVTAQGGRFQPKVEVAWNRFYTHAELQGIMDRLAAAWPDHVRFETVGQSFEGRPLRVMILTNQATGSDRDKVAMWVDGNIHGNEVQGAEATLYLAWWLLERQATNARAKALVDRRAFYLLPSQNPDGRDYWLEQPNGSSGSRSGTKPRDNDRDGQFDEDPPDDLDGDGEITNMRARVPLGQGDYRLDDADPRIMLPADRDHPGDMVLLGSEGIDNDGDGRLNEDSPGGYDLNRNWPADWRPGWEQTGAGDYPLSYPEPRAVARFILDHPNIAASQAFHNSGGMLLRGPGAEAIVYPGADTRVYDELGEQGERILPFYQYLITWRDLYTVHGGFKNWMYEGLGIFAFTNEMWNSGQMFGRRPETPSGGDEEESGPPTPPAPGRSESLEFNDEVLLGDAYVAWHPASHPLYGDIEIGGFKRQHGRVPPSFMIEEELHRNAMFCLRHAEAIADLVAEPPTVAPLGDGLFRVTATFRNTQLMPTRSAMAAGRRLGQPDLVTIAGPGLEVVAGGRVLDRYRPEQIALVEARPERLLLESGVGSRGFVSLAWLVRGGGEFTIRYDAQKADDVQVSGRLP